MELGTKVRIVKGKDNMHESHVGKIGEVISPTPELFDYIRVLVFENSPLGSCYTCHFYRDELEEVE